MAFVSNGRFPSKPPVRTPTTRAVEVAANSEALVVTTATPATSAFVDSVEEAVFCSISSLKDAANSRGTSTKKIWSVDPIDGGTEMTLPLHRSASCSARPCTFFRSLD